MAAEGYSSKVGYSGGAEGRVAQSEPGELPAELSESSTMSTSMTWVKADNFICLADG